MPLKAKRERELLEAVYATPDDDAPRAVLADAYTEVGDPRGTFIALQLAKARGEKVPRTAEAGERALLKAQGPKWNPFGNVLTPSSLKWERGFPVAGQLNLDGPWAEARTRATHPLASLSALATLRVLKLGPRASTMPESAARALLALSALKHLRHVESLPRALLVEFAQERPSRPLECIVCRPKGGGGVEGQKLEALTKRDLAKALCSGGLPQLRELELAWNHGGDKPEAYPWLSTSPAGGGLKRLRIDGFYLDSILPQWHQALTKWGSTVALETLEISHGWTVALQREGAKWALRGSIKNDSHQHAARGLREAIAKIGGTNLHSVIIDGFTNG